MQNQQKDDSLVGYLAATAPALFQLIAVISVGLVNVLNLDKFVLASQFINIANFLVILLSISLISLASFWDYNKFSLLKEGENIFSQTKRFWLVLRIFWVISVISALVFIGVILNKVNLKTYLELWSFLQWTAYIISMVSISFIIYAFALLKIQEKRNKNLYDNYIPRLVDSLRRYGHVKTPDIVIEYLDRENRMAIVKLGGSSKYQVITDFVGDMVSIEGIKNLPHNTQVTNTTER